MRAEKLPSSRNPWCAMHGGAALRGARTEASGQGGLALAGAAARGAMALRRHGPSCVSLFHKISVSCTWPRYSQVGLFGQGSCASSMFNRLSQVTRHLSRPRPGFAHASAAAFRPGSITSSIMATTTQQKSTIHTAGCLIIGDEVLGGKVPHWSWSPSS